MERNIFNDLTVCIPIRIDSQERYGNLEFVVNYLTNNTNIKIFIVEGDLFPKLSFDNCANNLRYQFVEDSNFIFHRTHYINLMLKNVCTKYAAIWDADIIVDQSQIYKALIKIEKEQCTMVLPYDGRCYYVPPYISNYVKEHNEYNVLEKYHELMQLMNGYKVVGGAFIVNVEMYKTAGWENEHFIGWGPEDAERVRRLYILGHKLYRIPGAIFHLYHPINQMGDNKRDVLYGTKKEYCHVCSMNPEELKAYISTWSWLKL